MQLKPLGYSHSLKENSLSDMKKRKYSNAAINIAVNNKERQKFSNNCLIYPNSNHLTRKCKTFLQKTIGERGEIVKNSNGCKLCLSQSHVGERCTFESSWGACKINGCNEYHSYLIHGCGIQGISMHVQNNSEDKDFSNSNVLLLVEKVKTMKGNILTFWDTGSTIALVARNYVQRMNLSGKPVSHELIAVGGVTSYQNTTLHEINLIDRKGIKYLIKACEIDDICGEIKAVNIGGIMHHFPYTKIQDVSRCTGKVELLVGMEYATLHPKPICERDALVLYNSFFGTGKLLGGSCDKISCLAQITALTQVCNVRVKRNSNPGIDFFIAEELGIKIPPRCNRCKDCKECKFEMHQLSRIEQHDLDVIRKNLQLDPTKNCWTTTYPYKCDPNVLEDNKDQVLLILERTEKRLARSKTSADIYCEQFRDFISRGILTEKTEHEDETYTGPRFYITHMKYLKRDHHLLLYVLSLILVLNIMVLV